MPSAKVAKGGISIAISGGLAVDPPGESFVLLIWHRHRKLQLWPFSSWTRTLVGSCRLEYFLCSQFRKEVKMLPVDLSDL